MGLCMRIVMLISICVSSLPVWAFDNGQYADVPNDVRAWFKGVRSPTGVSCCDIADGHRTIWKGDEAGRYWVPINGEWVEVPEEAVVNNAGSPLGEAVVWYTNYPGDDVASCQAMASRCKLRQREAQWQKRANKIKSLLS